MSDYIVLIWREEAAASASAIKARLGQDPGLQLAVDRRAMAVFLDRDLPLKCVQLPGQTGVVVGSVFDKAEALAGRGKVADLGQARACDPAAVCGRLIAEAWGAYVAVLPDADGAPNVFRDPLGGLECLTWNRDGVFVAASRLDPKTPHAPLAAEVDWAAIGALLRQKNLSSVTVPLRGVRGVDPGVLLLADGRRRRLWRPADFAASKSARRDVHPRALATVIDGCVAAWSAGRSGVLCEVSGGLDSAIVLAALGKVRAPIVGAIHHHWPQPEADERAFARAVAERAGLGLTERAHGLLVLNAGRLGQIASAARPSFSAADPDYDADMAARLEASGVDALFTGQGGDAVFYQMATAALAGDLLRGVPSARSRRAALALLAHRTRRTVWSLIGEALKTWRAPVAPHPSVSFLSGAYAAPRPGDRHPWLQDLTGVNPAKQVQIQALTNNQSMFGDSLRARSGQLIQPLMSQPVVEFCLSVPAPILAIGDVDRPFARAAYADRLPPVVRDRRWKGDLSVFFAQSMAQNLPFLRPYLMEGHLASHGLIDAARLEAILHRDELIWFDHAGELTIAFVLEAWARWWEAALATGSGPVATPVIAA